MCLDKQRPFIVTQVLGPKRDPDNRLWYVGMEDYCAGGNFACPAVGFRDLAGAHGYASGLNMLMTLCEIHLSPKTDSKQN